jgi:hypothetical protein
MSHGVKGAQELTELPTSSSEVEEGVSPRNQETRSASSLGTACLPASETDTIQVHLIPLHFVSLIPHDWSQLHTVCTPYTSRLYVLHSTSFMFKTVL